MDNYIDTYDSGYGYDNGDSILPCDFDDYDQPLYRHKKNCLEEYEIWDDPADNYDISPDMLRTQSKFQ